MPHPPSEPRSLTGNHTLRRSHPSFFVHPSDTAQSLLDRADDAVGFGADDEVLAFEDEDEVSGDETKPLIGGIGKKQVKSKKRGHKHKARRTFTLTTLFAKGAIFWRVWKACLGHTIWATIITCISILTPIDLGFSSILLTVLALVVGFVVSLRATAGIDRYWMGRGAWGDIMRNCRTLARISWLHVPTWFPPPERKDERPPHAHVEEQDIKRGLEEKRAFCDLILAFAVSTKHHLRGESGIYWEDLYPLVADLPQFAKPFQENKLKPGDANIQKGGDPHAQEASQATTSTSASTDGGVAAPDAKAGDRHEQVDTPVHAAAQSHAPDQTIESPAQMPPQGLRQRQADTRITMDGASDRTVVPGGERANLAPPAGGSAAYGTFPGGQQHAGGNGNAIASAAALHKARQSVGVYARIASWFSRSKAHQQHMKKKPSLVVHADGPQGAAKVLKARSRVERAALVDLPGHKFAPALSEMGSRHQGRHLNIPLSILWSMSLYLAVLDRRSTETGMPIPQLGSMYAAIAGFEDSLTVLEKILTTPLPFVFSVHLRHCVYIYLFTLPFQLVGPSSGGFGWLTIPGTLVASFFFLGFVAAGEEVEQPFGNDANDLDLDMFCRAVIGEELAEIMSWPPPDVEALRGKEKTRRGTRIEDKFVEWMVNRKNWQMEEVDYYPDDD